MTSENLNNQENNQNQPAVEPQPEPANDLPLITEAPTPTDPENVVKGLVIQSRFTLGEIAYFYHPKGDTAADLKPVKITVAGGFYKLTKNEKTKTEHADIWIISAEGAAYKEKHLYRNREEVLKLMVEQVTKL